MRCSIWHTIWTEFWNFNYEPKRDRVDFIDEKLPESAGIHNGDFKMYRFMKVDPGCILLTNFVNYTL